MPEAGHVAFLCPRLAEGAVVGGAETLLRALARRTAAAGRRVTFLTTCAVDHFTWRNAVPPGARRTEGLDVIYFPVDEDRDIPAFLETQDRISLGIRVSAADEQTWLRHNVNSRALVNHLATEGDAYDAIVMGPYLFGLVYFAAQARPERTLLVPCLHDEPFARLDAFRGLFRSVRGFLFNTAPERDLARRLYGLDEVPGQVEALVGMGLEPADTDPRAFAAQHGITAPYIIYAGRREPLKGTPLLIDYLAAFRARTGRDLKLVFTGSGPVDIPAELAPHVLDAGFVPEQAKLDAMAGAVAFCHPSLNESLGIVLLEAWLAGTPGIVHARSKVLRWQCENSHAGLWFRTYPEFEECLLMLMDRPGLRETLGQQGRAYVRDAYAWDAVESRLLAAVDQSLSPTTSTIASSAR